MKKSRKIYLDHNATTPVDPRVLKVMLPYFSEKFGNPSSNLHIYGWETEEAVEIAREQIADSIGARSNEIYFTSGATESINLALMGLSQACKENGNHIITCKTEHKAVLDTCKHLQNQGFEVTWLDVDNHGAIDLQDLEHAINEKTILVCLMHANNETGVIHPIKEISDLAKDRGVLFMTDATQSIGKIPINVDNLGIDAAAFSSHKLYGPKGVGALYRRNRPKVKMSPYLFGGGQERGIRPGTLNVPGIVGFGKAVELCSREMQDDADRLSTLRNTIDHELSILGDVQINGQNSKRLPHMTNLSFQHIEEAKLIPSLKDLAVSRGSSCSSTTIKPSHVLKNMGLSDQLALSSIRIGLGRYTTEEEVRVAIDSIKTIVEELRLTTT